MRNLITLALLCCLTASGCALLGIPVEDGASPSPSPSEVPVDTGMSRGELRAPAEWRRTFCDAQQWVDRAFFRINRALSLLGSGDLEELEEAAEDMGRAVARAELFVLVVPRWRPAQNLVLAELAMLAEAYEAAERIEFRSRTSTSRNAAVNGAIATMRRAFNEYTRAVQRARNRGIPCAMRFRLAG
jgi:hypothetical protein